MIVKKKLFRINSVLKASALMLILLFGCSEDPPEPPIVPEPVNKAPSAVAGEDQKAALESIVKLDASGSTDPDKDELSYTWSLKVKPENSSASIVGVGSEKAEFTLDKAGSYEVELTVNDGELEARDSFMVTNKTPILNRVNTNIPYFSNDELAQKGRRISISGNFFSKDINEMEVALGEIPLEITNTNSSESVTVTLPENAVSGNLVVSVGEESVTWSKPIRMISLPIEDFVEANTQLEVHIREPLPSQTSEYFEIGTLFKPMVSGTVEAFILKLPISGGHDVTLWDASTKTVLATETLSAQGGSKRINVLSTPVALEAGKEYAITFNSNHWYLHIDEENGQGDQFPQTFENIELLRTAFHAGPDTFYPDEGLALNYITAGADIIFAADPQ